MIFDIEPCHEIVRLTVTHAAQRDLELGAIAKIEFEQAALFVFTPGEHDSSPYCGRTERVRHRHWAVCVLPFVAQHAGATV